MGPEAFFLVLGVIALAVFIRIMAGSLDTGRIDQYISDRGGHIVEKHWTPFGKGWFGEKDSRIYTLTYEDAEGNLHEATCKTSMLSGVYFTEDRIVQRRQRRKRQDDDTLHNDTTAQEDNGVSSLQEENRRLREEIERLRIRRNDDYE
jgi:hypothetical protein